MNHWLWFFFVFGPSPFLFAFVESRRTNVVNLSTTGTSIELPYIRRRHKEICFIIMLGR